MQKFKRIVQCGLAFGLLAHPAYAADGTRMEDTVLVTAGRIAEKASTVTQAATVISREEIEKNSHKTLEDILRQNGVQVHRAGGADTTMTPQISLRGLRSSQGDPNTGNVMVLIDGRRTASTNIAMIPMVSIERVEILRGPAAVQYGTTAMGGVVNVITRRGGEDTQASLELGGGSWETWKGMGGVSGMAGNVDYTFGFSQSTRNGDWKDGDGNRIHNSQYNRMTSYSANVGYTFLDTQRIGVSILGADYDRLGDWGGVYGMYGYAPHGTTPDAYSDRDNYALDVNYEGDAGEYGLSWMLRYSNAREKYLYKDPSSGYDPSTNKAQNQGTQAQLTWKYDVLTLTGGVDWSESKYRTNGAENKDCELDNIGSFLLAKTAFFDEKLIFSLGARYDDFSLKFKDTDRSKDNVSLSAGVAYNPLDWLSFRANVGESYRMPTGLEIAGYQTGYGSYYGNPDLEPEKGLGWDAGFEIEKNAFRAGLTYFSTDYKKKISTESVAWDYKYINLPGTTEFRGVEGHASYDVGQAFDWPFMLRPYTTFTHMFKYEDGQGKDVQYVREWTAGFGVNYSHPSIGLEVDLCFTYLGDQKETNFNTYPSSVITTGGDVTADLTVVKTLHEWEDYGRLSMKGELRNIFNKEYALNFGYPMPGRSFFASLVWQY